MKIILTGATGFVGAEVLEQCLANNFVDAVIVLSRRPLSSDISNPKLQVIVLEDFMVYSADVIKELAGSEACIWNIGVTPKKDTNAAETRRVSLDYTIAGAEIFATHLAPQLGEKKFRFIYTSGFLTERNQERNLWMKGDFRKMRGEVENQLISCAESHPNEFEVEILKPGGIIPKNSWTPPMLSSIAPMIKVDIAAASMISLALKGGNKQTLENQEIVLSGQAALRGE